MGPRVETICSSRDQILGINYIFNSSLEPRDNGENESRPLKTFERPLKVDLSNCQEQFEAPGSVQWNGHLEQVQGPQRGKIHQQRFPLTQES